MDLLKALLMWWFVGIPALALIVLVFLAAIAILGAPLWLLMWWSLG